MVHLLKFIKLKKVSIRNSSIKKVHSFHQNMWHYYRTQRLWKISKYCQKNYQINSKPGFYDPTKGNIIPSKKVDFLGFIIEPGKIITYLTD